MIKRFKHIIILLTLLLTSCSEWLELTPLDGLVQDEYWKTKEDVKATLMGAYQKLAQMDELLFLYGEMRGDMLAEDNNTPSYVKRIMEGNIYSNNQLCNWSDFYEIINYCNFVLKYNPIIFEADGTYSQYQKQGVDSEALFLRSLAYFYLVRIFKDVPFVVDPTESDNVELYHPKSSDTTILRAIKADLLEARKFVTDDYGSLENNLGRASKNAINALLADICLWNYEYEESISYIEEIEKSVINLVYSGQWFSIFYPGNSIEGIFEIQYNSIDQGNSMYKLTYTDNLYTTSLTAIGILNPEQIRGTYEEQELKIWKYCGSAADRKSLRPGSEKNSANWIIYRYADILLMKAEALSQLGSYDEALENINKVSERANMGTKSAPQNPESFEDLILEERAIELAYEGKRWFDLLRMGRRNNFARKDKLIEILILDVPSNQKLVLASKLTNPMGWYMPIADTELERNKNLEQNPYYEGY